MLLFWGGVAEFQMHLAAILGFWHVVLIQPHANQLLINKLMNSKQAVLTQEVVWTGRKCRVVDRQKHNNEQPIILLWFIHSFRDDSL